VVVEREREVLKITHLDLGGGNNNDGNKYVPKSFSIYSSTKYSGMSAESQNFKAIRDSRC
jgi:hypothetical protein